MTKKITWRLSKLPSPDEVRELVKDKIITQEEARDILFKENTEESRDSESLKTEIKFLRDLVEKLSERSSIVKQIEYIQPNYGRFEWYKPYMLYCSTPPAAVTNYSNGLGSGITNAVYCSSTDGKAYSSLSSISNF